MRIVLRTLAVLVGLLLLAVGVATAVVVGPDDTVFNEETVIEGRPIATVTDLFSYDDLELVVQAEGPDGVFIGTANGVDVADYLAEAAHTQVYRVERTGLVSKRIAAEEKPVAAADADFWTTVEQGEGVQTMRLRVDGDSPRVVIDPMGGAATVSFGITLAGLFLLGVLVAVTGGLILLATVASWLLSRRRRRRSREVATADPSPSTGTATPPIRTSRSAAVPVVLAGVLALGGCGAAPRPVAYREPVKVALAEDEAVTMLADFDRRHGRATKAAGKPRYDDALWEEVDTGPMLDVDQFATGLAKARREKTGRAEERVVDAVYAGEFASYPMWAIVAEHTTADEKEWAKQGGEGKGKGDDEEPMVDLTVYTRERAIAPWLASTSVSIPRDLLPATGSSAAVAARQDLSAVQSERRRISGYIETGGDGTAMPDELRSLRKQVAGYEKSIRESVISRVEVGAEPHRDERLRAVRVGDAVVTIETLDTDLTIYGDSGRTLVWTDKVYEKVRASGRDNKVAINQVVTVAYFVPDLDDPEVEVLGATLREFYY